ncbi:MAG: isocitrate lyase/PEP mutase family protein [Pseudomonadales bacterium]|nr:isocitrate lyase/PEP mutase family protein [Pseudomonadales bacterium]
MNLRERLQQGEKISAPGVFDPFSARIADQMGFPVLYMTGYGVNASLLGLPDAAFASYGEMVARVRSITEVTDACLIADGDTGFGGLHNVERAVSGYEAAGADAIQLEDQEFPKRCGHTRNRKVIAIDDMKKKIVVAAAARASDDFQIIARTDALSEHGLDEALRRAEAYVEVGADILFVESPESEDQMRAICERFPQTPLIANMVAGGRTPLLSDSALFDIGYQIIIHPVYLLGAALTGIRRAAAQLQSTGVEADVDNINGLNEVLGFDKIWAMDEKFGA